MISRWKRREHHPAQPLSTRAIVLWSVVVLGSGLAALTVLWWRYGVGADVNVKLDLIRTAGGVMVVAGGALTLLLAARRQAHTERDTSEQRITELYTRAVDQLGAEKAPVRLGGLHALERLGQDNPAQRQTIVDVICAYLRMPYTPPDDQAPGEDAPEEAHSRYEQRRQELQVRLTAQRILTAHLRPGSAAFWAKIELDLTGAHLHEFVLSVCHVSFARFDGATFVGIADFTGATFARYASFHEATFVGSAAFMGATFAGHAAFDEARFAGDAAFDEARFAGEASFRGAEFGRAEFVMVGFRGVEFGENAEFDGARVALTSLYVGGALDIDGVLSSLDALGVVLPMGWITRPAQPAEGEDEGWLYVVRDEDSSEQSAEAPE